MFDSSGYAQLGTFRVESGELRVSDPCYCPTPRPNRAHMDTDGEGIFRVPALNGTWHLRATLNGEGRVAELQAYHEGLHGHDVEQGDEHGELYVDSGQMGVFDDGRFPRDEAQFEYGDETSFYKRACNLTWSDDMEESRPGGCLEFGGVTSAGYGDGSYPGFVQTDAAGLAIAVTVQFIAEDEDDEEYDDDDDDLDDDDEEDDEDDDEDEDDEPEDDD